MEYGNVYSESTTETELVHKPIFQNLYANTSTSTASNIKNEPTENSGIAPSIFDNDSDSFGAPDHFDDDFQSNDDNNLSYLPLKTDAKQTSRTPISRQVAPTVPKIQEPRIPKVKRKKGEKTKSEPKNLYPCTFCGLEFKMVQHCIRHEMVHTGLK